MQFLWCGFHLSPEERQQDPFCNQALLPCATTDCALFREEAPLCVHLVREGSGSGWEDEGRPLISPIGYID
jgi:hypothetical protein